MCGIFGSVPLARSKKPLIDREGAERCTDALAHRGPDAQGVYHVDGAWFGHRRLSIIDVQSRADQPFISPDGKVVLTYNGEIYNYVELQRELRQSGVQFHTESDTEVLLHAYLKWGIHVCISKLVGIFAFALFDTRSNDLWLVRDRLGVKPLYYLLDENRLVFASEIAAVLRHPGVIPKLNPRAVSCFLSYRAVYGSSTLIEGVSKLEPGEILHLKHGVCSKRLYWDVTLAAKPSYDTSSLRSRLSQVIGQQLRADVPVGILLSGGLDSSIIASEAANIASVKPLCFTVGSTDQNYDESPYAQLVAEHNGLEIKIVTCGLPDSINLVDELVRRRGHPLGMHNEIAMHLIARAVSEECKVVLTGEGADELFGGYSRLSRLPFDLQRVRHAHRLPKCLQSWTLARWGLNTAPSTDLALFIHAYTYFEAQSKLSLFKKELRQELDDDGWIYALFKEQFERAAHRSFFDKISLVLFKHHLPALLEMVDGVTMAAGVEARVPYCDHELAQTVLNLHESTKLRWRSLRARLRALGQPIQTFSEHADTSKYALRLIYSEVLPRKVVDRKKMGFPVPLGRWATGPASIPFRQRMFGSDSSLQVLFNMDALRDWYKHGLQRQADEFGKQVWLLANLEAFIRHCTRP